MKPSSWRQEPITPEQVRAIHAQRKRVMDEDAYRAMLRSRFGVESTLALTKGQAVALLDHLRGKPLQSTGGASFRQIGFLRHVLGQCGLSEEQAIAYVRARFTKRPILRLEDLNQREATQAIKGAKSWLAVLEKQAQGETNNQT